jgi:hypothetical protein
LGYQKLPGINDHRGKHLYVFAKRKYGFLRYGVLLLSRTGHALDYGHDFLQPNTDKY